MTNRDLFQLSRHTRPDYDFRQTARLSWDMPRTPYRPSPMFVRAVAVLLALIVLAVQI